jgi:hypothetical protein
MEVSGQLHAPAALPPGKEHPVPIEFRRLDGPQNRYGRGGGEIPCRESNPITPII